MTAIAFLDESTASSWDRTLYAVLAEKHRRSGSQRTVQAYSRMPLASGSLPDHSSEPSRDKSSFRPETVRARYERQG